jgi:glucosamine-6-phosphate deaminase
VSWTRFRTDEELGTAIAHLAIEIAKKSGAARGKFVLGLPAGRSPRSTFRSVVHYAGSTSADLSRIHIVLMDEFVERAASGWRICDREAHFSCRRLIEAELLEPLRQVLGMASAIPPENLHWPDPSDPDGYETLVECFGGIDLFLLASGTSDGHVAFNPPGTSLSSRTRVLELAETTRSDNVATFPEFRGLHAVPRHGVSVGLGTVSRWSRRAILILNGSHKQVSAQRLRQLGRFDASWPASVIFECNGAAIFVDDAGNGNTAKSGTRQ